MATPPALRHCCRDKLWCTCSRVCRQVVVVAAVAVTVVAVAAAAAAAAAVVVQLEQLVSTLAHWQLHRAAW
jgi:hypothetical protein